MFSTADTFTGPYPYTVDGISYAYTEDLSNNFSVGIQVYFNAPVSYYEFSVVFDRGDVNPQVYTFTGCSDCTSTVTLTELPPFVPGGALATVSGTAPNVTQMAVTLGIDPSTPASVGPLVPLGFAFTNLNNPPSTGISQIGAPEPSTLILFGSGLLALAGARRCLMDRRRMG